MATPLQALEKLKHYCAYQDRCHQEVQQKLFDLKVWGEDADEIIFTLIQENFLNEERYAKSFARGKFKMKQWGRKKIRYALKRKDISDYCIKKGMQEIEEEKYKETLRHLAQKKKEALQGGNTYQNRHKIYQHLVRKGYEYELIKEVLEEIRD